MANIGTFTKTEQGFTGELVTLSLKAKNVRLVEEAAEQQRERADPPGLCRKSGDRRRLGRSAPTRAGRTCRSSSTIQASTLRSTPT